MYLLEFLSLFFVKRMVIPWRKVWAGDTPFTWCFIFLLPPSPRQVRPAWLPLTHMEPAEASRTLQRAGLPWERVQNHRQPLWSVSGTSVRRWLKRLWLSCKPHRTLLLEHLSNLSGAWSSFCFCVSKGKKMAKREKEKIIHLSWTVKRACPRGEGSQGHQQLWQLNTTSVWALWRSQVAEATNHRTAVLHSLTQKGLKALRPLADTASRRCSASNHPIAVWEIRRHSL